MAFLPENYFKDKREFPVIYLLHGLFGSFDNWINLTNLADYAKKSQFIIICPEAENSWYVDNLSLKNHFFESYIFDELIPDAEQRFRVIKERNSRIIGGLSMGGYAAFKFAFRRPQSFSAAISMSGAFDIPKFLINENKQFSELHPYIADAFKNLSADELRREDLFYLAQKFPVSKISALPYFYFDCGTNDSFIEINRTLSDFFIALGIKHRFLEFSGGHNWKYWDKQIEFIIESHPELIFK